MDDQIEIFPWGQSVEVLMPASHSRPFAEFLKSNGFVPGRIYDAMFRPVGQGEGGVKAMRFDDPLMSVRKPLAEYRKAQGWQIRVEFRQETPRWTVYVDGRPSLRSEESIADVIGQLLTDYGHGDLSPYADAVRASLAGKADRLPVRVETTLEDMVVTAIDARQ